MNLTDWIKDKNLELLLCIWVFITVVYIILIRIQSSFTAQIIIIFTSVEILVTVLISIYCLYLLIKNYKIEVIPKHSKYRYFVIIIILMTNVLLSLILNQYTYFNFLISLPLNFLIITFLMSPMYYFFILKIRIKTK